MSTSLMGDGLLFTKGWKLMLRSRQMRFEHQARLVYVQSLCGRTLRERSGVFRVSSTARFKAF